jgi:hypothetical protein
VALRRCEAAGAQAAPHENDRRARVASERETHPAEPFAAPALRETGDNEAGVLDRGDKTERPWLRE